IKPLRDLADAISYPPSDLWAELRLESADERAGLGMIAYPAGNSPMRRRCGVSSPPKRALISRSASGCRVSGTPRASAAHRRVGSSGWRADPAEAQHHVARAEAAPQRGGQPRGIVAVVLGPGQTKSPPGQRLDGK